MHIGTQFCVNEVKALHASTLAFLFTFQSNNVGILCLCWPHQFQTTQIVCAWESIFLRICIANGNIRFMRVFFCIQFGYTAVTHSWNGISYCSFSFNLFCLFSSPSFLDHLFLFLFFLYFFFLVKITIIITDCFCCIYLLRVASISKLPFQFRFRSILDFSIWIWLILMVIML